ncbi:unnamed protein product [Dovyalis caffra]|uniref:Phytocyanin domain-containing protein n=1 Tax=Dovyalis caffra TaxID=77055 RepID=A0AAV1R7U5_9ROSI|nr:unnamed protein product [Dovyalis caffra]
MASSTYVQALILLLSASMWAISMANRQWQHGFNYPDWSHKRHPSRQNSTDTPNKIVVGGSQNWTFGVNYTDWALKNGPFYFNDTLVFKYDPPSDTNIHPHSVYLLPNLWSFLKCDLSKAMLIANATEGGGDGFEFVLKKWQPYYFACGGGAGFHCNNGTMKFFVMPMFRRGH